MMYRSSPVARLLDGIARAAGRVVRGTWRIARVLIPAAAFAACRPADRSGAATAHAAVATARGAAQTTPAARALPPDADVDATGPVRLGSFQMTFYYLIVEGEHRPHHHGHAAPVDAGAPLIASVAANDEQRATGDTGAPDGDGDGAGAIADGTDPADGIDAGAPAAANDQTLAAVTPTAAPSPDDEVTLYDHTCHELAHVTRRYAAGLTLQGSGRLRDGRTLNVWGRCACPRSPCFRTARARWGLGGDGQPLSPFRTVAVDPKVVPIGSLLYIPALDGLRMPGRAPIGGFIHDGCVVADDTGGHVKGKQVDLFVGRRGYWLGLARRGGSHAWAHHVEIFDGTGRCTRHGGQVTRTAAGSI
jgi:3D (Asp-Asp-Asp) domain-containing protein